MRSVPPAVAGGSASVSAELSDSLSQNLGTTLKFVRGHKFSRAVRFADVAWTDHDSFAAERHHVRCFRAECNRAAFEAGRLFEHLD
jgi:hypothetical protein